LFGVATAVPAFHLFSLLLMFLVASMITGRRDEQVGMIDRENSGEGRREGGNEGGREGGTYGPMFTGCRP
jgi:hypothetical protein